MQRRDRNRSYAEAEDDHGAKDHEFVVERPRKRNVTAAAAVVFKNLRQIAGGGAPGALCPRGSARQRRGRPQRRRARNAVIEVAINSGRTILSWLIEMELLAHLLLFLPQDIVVHASGHNSYRPYDNIIVCGAQSSLFHCQIVAWRSEKESDWSIANQFVLLNDDACMICGVGSNYDDFP